MRNIRCPAYSGCLNAAIELALSDFECDACQHRRETDAIDPAELDGAALMLIAIFFPATYAEIQKKNSFNKKA